MQNLSITLLLDANFATEWYPQFGLPPQLLRDFAPWASLPTLESFPALPEPYFTERLTAKLRACSGIHRPCHDEQHASRVLERGDEAIDALIDMLGFNPFSKGYLQAQRLGLAGHDHGHPGAAWLADAHPQQLPPLPQGFDGDLADYPLEYITSWLNDDDNVRDDIPMEFRIVETYIDWASSNGAAMERGRRMHIGSVKPRAFTGLLTRAADVTFSDDLTLNTHFEANLLWVETPISSSPTTMAALLANRHGFLDHVERTYDQFDAAARQVVQSFGMACPTAVSLTTNTGWRHNLAKARRKLHKLANGEPTMTAILKTALENRGVTLV